MDRCNNCNPSSSRTAGDSRLSALPAAHTHTQQFKQGAAQVMETVTNKTIKTLCD